MKGSSCTKEEGPAGRKNTRNERETMSQGFEIKKIKRQATRQREKIFVTIIFVIVIVSIKKDNSEIIQSRDRKEFQKK